MSECFAVGEVVICVAVSPPSDLAKYVGEELTVTGPLERVACITGGLAYSVTHRDGKEMWAAPFTLRKKRPPDHPDNLAKWDDCQWSPDRADTHTRAVLERVHELKKLREKVAP